MGARRRIGDARNLKLLLDTHVLFWFDTDPDRLSSIALDSVRDASNLVYISSIVAWELTIKNRLGKLPNADVLLANYHATLARYSFIDLPFSSNHALAERELTNPNDDPFDRALVAQASVEKLVLVSADPKLAKFREVDLLW